MSRPFKNRTRVQTLQERLMKYGLLVRWGVVVLASIILVFCLCSIIFTIEIQIKYNHLEGVGRIDTTGQIVPLAVGCLSLGRAVILVVLWSIGAIETESLES